MAESTSKVTTASPAKRPAPPTKSVDSLSSFTSDDEAKGIVKTPSHKRVGAAKTKPTPAAAEVSQIRLKKDQ